MARSPRQENASGKVLNRRFSCGGAWSASGNQDVSGLIWFGPSLTTPVRLKTGCNPRRRRGKRLRCVCSCNVLD